MVNSMNRHMDHRTVTPVTPSSSQEYLLEEILRMAQRRPPRRISTESTTTATTPKTKPLSAQKSIRSRASFSSNKKPLNNSPRHISDDDDTPWWNERFLYTSSGKEAISSAIRRTSDILEEEREEIRPPLYIEIPVVINAKTNEKNDDDGEHERRGNF